MKLTRSTNAKEAEFFRDTNKGNLIDKNSPNIDITTDIIKDLPNEDSFIGRILLNPTHPSKKDYNRFRDFVEDLVKNDSMELSKYLPKLNKYEDVEKAIDNSFSYYGKNLKYDKDVSTLKELLRKHYNNENIDSELNQLHNNIQTFIGYKIEKLTKSIVGNTIPFEIKNDENDKLKPNTKKMEFLFGLLKADGVDKTTFESFKAKYSYSILEDRITTYVTETVDKGRTLSCNKIYDMVLEYNHNFYKSNEPDADIEAYVFFSNEIRNHFRNYFPIKNKNKSKSERLSNLNEKNAKYYCSERFVLGQFGQVWKHIVNQLVQGLIMYGKLEHYYFDKGEHEWETNKISSDGLSEIQIEEALKKHIFVSLCRASTRLNYFFNFGSQNIDLFGENKLNATQDDIYLRGKKKKQQEKSFREKFYQQIIENKNNEFEELRSKMAICFPLQNNDGEYEVTEEQLCSLLEETVLTCYEIRNNVFHYKKESLYEVLSKNLNNLQKKLEKDKVTIKYPEYKFELLKKDIYNIQSGFEEQIRSSCIAEYYSLETLTQVFKSGNLNFFLYGGQYPMVPSFKNIFTRGCNISEGKRNEDNTTWFVENKYLNKDAHLAYKNLIQLIYYHSFTPAIKDHESIITAWINKTKQWKKNLAISKQPKDKKKAYQYRYNDMPDYEYGVKLSDYLGELQRLQAIRENENNENNNDKENYYVNFVKDVFAFAFNDYLQSKISFLCGDIKSPRKQDNAKEILSDLFAKTQISLEITANQEELEKFGSMYLFLKLLDQRELNKLLHQFIKYRTSTKNNSKDLQSIEELIALVQFTLPQPCIDENYKQNLEQFFSKFIDKDYKTDYVKLYYDEDKKTPILQRSISLVGRSGAMALYTDIFTRRNKLYNVTKSDYNKYCDYNHLDSSEPSKIEEKQKELQELHEMLVKVKNTSNMKEEIDKYEKLAKEIQEYNSCRQKITFETLYKVNQIHIDILERFASFAEDWERDMFFMLTALKSLGEINFNVNRTFKGRVVGNLAGEKGKLTNNQKYSELFCSLCWVNENINSDDIYDKMEIRNTLAHLNHMTQCTKNEEDKIIYQPSIIDIINKLRVLLAYDLKRQNSVTKSIKELLLKNYKIKLILEPEKTKKEPKIFKIKSLNTDYIEHLKNIKEKTNEGKYESKIKIKANDKLLIDLTEELLNFKY